ncbi:tryptophan 7-halogenase [Caulobacter sp.]|uniref:tryptophan 7-halogenase n=1 Tax=Caulobacter sp. TaxID=78 RepID=UPI001B2F1F17|nr:tryptophan 7-halogenase [Caulobacter sp.]MBO9545728.1 tryptophan 7-halogenase [Caulobacter sp.]
MKILIVGTGVDAWLTAAVLAGAAGRAARIAVRETAPPAHGQLVGLPALLGLHARLGIEVGAPLLGLRHGDMLEPFGDTGAMMEGLPFHHYWLRAKAHGETAPLEAWSLTARAAAKGRFAPRSADPRSPLSTLDHGLLLDAAAYAETLKAVALKAGAELVDHRPDADLVVDASGEPGDWIDWSAWLPTGARLTGVEDRIATFAHDAPLKAGRRARAVEGDVVAVGGALASIGAADGGDLHLLQTTVSRLAALLPTGPAAVAEFNRLTAMAVERARDMAILRWGVLDAPPEELAWKIGQFESRGRVVMYDEETWPEGSWVHALLARGVTPKRWDPLVERAPLAQTREMLGRMKAVLEQTAEAMPRG